MEGKGVLFKRFAGIDVFDIEVEAESPQAFIDTVARIHQTFGGLNLKAIKALECLEIEAILKDRCDIPFFHEDHHGTAILAWPAFQIGLTLIKKKIEDIRMVSW